MCTGVEIALLTTAAAAASTSGYQASESVQAGRRAKNKQEELEAQRRATLASEAADREAAKERAAVSGRRAGLGGRGLVLGATDFGAGSGDTAPTGRGALFGN